MPTQEQESALGAAYNKAYENLGALSNQYGPGGVKDHSMVVHSGPDVLGSPFSYFFQLLSLPAGEMPYSKFSFDNEEWRSYLIIQAWPAVLIAIAGILVSCWLVSQLWCSKPKSMSEHKIEIHACVGFILLWVVVGMTIGRGTYAYDMCYESVVQLEPDLNFIVGKVEILQPGFHNAAIWLDDWQTSCAGWSALEPTLGEKIREVNKKYVSKVQEVADTLYTLDRAIFDLPYIVAEIRMGLDWFVREFQALIFCVIFAPTLLASFVTIFLVLTISCQSEHRAVQRITNLIVFDLGAIPMVVVILTMTAVAAAICYAGTVMGSFCSSPEQNTINLVSATQQGTRNSSITGLVSFYVTGSPNNNTIVETLREVESVVNPISKLMWIIGPALDLLGLWCHRVGSADLSNLLNGAIPTVKKIIPLAKRDHVYSHFDEIVTRGMCQQLAGCFGWYMICTIVSGLYLLPRIAYESHKYLLHMKEKDQERQQAEKSREVEKQALLSTINNEDASKPRTFWQCCSRARAPVVG